MQANEVPYMTKDLRKATMEISQLKTKCVKTNTLECLRSYQKQNIFCSKLCKKERKKYYNSLKAKQSYI